MNIWFGFFSSLLNLDIRLPGYIVTSWAIVSANSSGWIFRKNDPAVVCFCWGRIFNPASKRGFVVMIIIVLIGYYKG
jgi:hypothetical protein